MKHIIISIFVAFLFITLNNIQAQDTVDHWESVILAPDSARYFPGDSAPDTEWKALSFNDGSWLDGNCSIGYGDGDDSTVIDPMLSVYVRKEFDIVDTASISRAVLHVDYDDAFVAYINGEEIARANIGSAGTEPAYNEPAASNHEAEMYSGGLPETFTISKEKLSEHLQPGNNVLSVQVHNVTDNSSDMSCNIFLSLGINDQTTNYRSTPDWFNPPPEPFTSSNLPILIINTNDGGGIPDEPKVEGEIKIAYNTLGNRNHVDGPYHESSGAIGIETRGNSTQMFPKKPYLFETRHPIEDRDSLGENRNIEMLGLPTENDWILRACYIDKTLMRQAIPSFMSHNMGRYTSRFAFCEVVVNGSYEGVYLLMEQIKQDNDRLNIDELYPWTTDPDSITGGYIYEVSQSGDGFGERRQFNYPDADEINTAQANYIQDYDDSFRAVMEQPNYADPRAGYPMWIDVNAFIDEIIIQEACSNSDAYGWSSHFHKDRLRKLAAGPVWDFDQALANSSFNDGDRVDEWIIDKGLNGVPSFWPKLFHEPVFKYLLKERWFELRETVLHTDSLMHFIDSTAAYLEEAQQRNFKRWPILGEELWRSLPGWDERDTYQKEVDYMKTWLDAHLEWIDDQLAAVPDRTVEVPSLVISEIMYAPEGGPENEFIEIVNTGDETVDLTGIFFSDGITYTFPEGKELASGEYVVIAANTNRFEIQYDFKPMGEYYKRLDNTGERVTLQTSLGRTIDEVDYDDASPWPVVDEIINPRSIELTDLNADNALPESWTLSETRFGTPENDIPSSMTGKAITANDTRLYPNPVQDQLNIRFTHYYEGELNVQVYNSLGTLQRKLQQDHFTGHRLTLPVHELDNGHYFVKITLQESTITKQILIAR